MGEQRKYFGTDGIRGVANQSPLDPESLVRLGRAIASIFLARRGKHRILIGKDTRLSGYMIESSLVAGITSMGADVWLCGPIATPGVAYLTRSMRADAGVMISASHNPYEDNGIKIFAADGNKLPDDVELQIERFLENEAPTLKGAESSLIGKAMRIDDAVGRYTVYLKECFPRELTLENLRIGFDGANGASYVVGPQVCSELGAEVSSRGVSPNGRNINAGFGSLFPEVVGKLVVEQNLDIGISLDGDGDRVILVDEKGTVLDGDLILALCAVDLKKRGKLKRPEIVATVMSNLGLERYLEKFGISVFRAGVGDRYVLEAMQSRGIELGGEQSGHIIFSEHSTTGDGILSALMVLAAMVREKSSLSELTAGFVRFPQKLINVPVSSKPPLESVDAITKVVKQKEDELKSNGRILVRYSGTENKARVMVECEDLKQCERHAEEVAEVISRALGV